jgi:prevent-host-death family protein
MKQALQIGAFEAKNRLSELLQRVENGEEVTITRHGKPVARLVPAEPFDRERVIKALEDLKRMRKRYRLGGLNLKDLVNEGRKI